MIETLGEEGLRRGVNIRWQKTPQIEIVPFDMTTVEIPEIWMSSPGSRKAAPSPKKPSWMVNAQPAEWPRTIKQSSEKHNEMNQKTLFLS
jgi:hypothetical protein